MMQAMRVLHILDHSIPLQSGYTFRTRNILRHQRKLGWETFHVTGLKQGGGPELEEDVDGLHFFRTPESSSLLKNLPMLNQLHVVNTLAGRMAEVVEQVRPAILHAHSPALNGLAALRVARKYKLPLVYECRAFWEDAAVDHGTNSEWGLRYRLTRALESRVFGAADAVTTICEGLRSDIVARGNPEEKVTVIPNAVDLDDFRLELTPDAALADSLGLHGRTVLGFIGSFYAYEGIPLLLEALPAVRELQPDIALLLVGGGPDEGKIRRRIKELGLEDCVVLTGRVPHNDVQRYYSLVDIFVYPRLPMRLTNLVTPLKPLEAMAQGRLVVASDVGGHRELITPGKNGYLFRANDVADLAKMLGWVLSEAHRWNELTAAGREYVEAQRNWQASVGRYQAVYGALA
jgi:PEP-CTERM/exosortase A-associated glycosyltransferase